MQLGRGGVDERREGRDLVCDELIHTHQALFFRGRAPWHGGLGLAYVLVAERRGVGAVEERPVAEDGIAECLFGEGVDGVFGVRPAVSMVDETRWGNSSRGLAWPGLA